MALDPVILDDLDWKGMVEAIRRRIPAASNGEWTLHAPVDPGVTLLELFAAQLEQRVYRLDQVTPELSLALLALLGHRPRRTRHARTMLQLIADQAGAVPRGAEFMLDGAEPAMVYATCSAQTMLALTSEQVRVWTGARERSAELAMGQAIDLLPADGSTAEARFELALKAAPPAGSWFGMFLALHTAAAIAPQWGAQAASAPAPAALEWLYRASDGALRRFGVDDGTGGLRRSGLLRLKVPTDWQPESGSGAYAIIVRTASATFSAPPRLAAVQANVVMARHAHDSGCISARLDWLPLPGNVIRLGQLATAALPISDAACVLYLREQVGGWRQWWPALSLHNAGPARRAFTIDRARAQLRFGDGLNGRLPVLASDGADNLCVRYLAGGGSAGTVGASGGLPDNWQGPAGLRARNLTESAGGAEPETLDQARRRAAAELRLVTRAVTRPDFETIALATPGVAVRRAHAAIGRHPLHPCISVPGAVTVFVVPDVPRDADRDAFVVAAPLADPGMLAAIAARLQVARLIGSEVFVAVPRYHAVGLRVLLRGEAGDAGALRQRIFERLQRVLDPLVGGEQGDGWPFGEPLRASVMLREVQAAAGPQLDVRQVAIGVDGAVPSESCVAVTIGAHDLVWLAAVELQLEASAAAVGGLR